MGPPLPHAPSTSCCRRTNPSPLGGGPLALQATIARWPSRPWSRHDQGLAVVGLGGLDTGAGLGASPSVPILFFGPSPFSRLRRPLYRPLRL